MLFGHSRHQSVDKKFVCSPPQAPLPQRLTSAYICASTPLSTKNVEGRGVPWRTWTLFDLEGEQITIHSHNTRNMLTTGHRHYFDINVPIFSPTF